MITKLKVLNDKFLINDCILLEHFEDDGKVEFSYDKELLTVMEAEEIVEEFFEMVVEQFEKDTNV